LLNAGGTSLTGAQTITVSGISAKDKIMVLIHIASSASASSQISFRINTDTGTNYYSASSFLIWGSTYVDNNMGINTSFSDSKFDAGKMSSDAASQVNSTMIITGGNTSGLKQVVVSGSASRVTGSGQTASPMYGGFYDSASTVSSVSVVSSSGNFDNGIAQSIKIMTRLCAAGVQLREQIDDDYPDRDRKSDGWIADARHLAKALLTIYQEMESLEL
jgi:hypothetical protein